MTDIEFTQSETLSNKNGLDTLLMLCSEHHEVGSRVTCSPPPVDSDRDILCLVRDWRVFVSTAIRDGFTIGGSNTCEQFESAEREMKFISLKRNQDNVNLIITESREFVRSFLSATKIAKRLNILDKEDRIALFQIILYGKGLDQ